MAAIGDVLVKFVADFAEFSSGMNDGIKKLEGFGAASQKASEGVQSFVEGLKKIAAVAGVGALANEFKGYLDNIEKTTLAMAEQATALNLSATQYQAYSRAAAEAGTSTQTLNGAISTFNGALRSAQQGSKAQVEAFQQLGVKILDVNGQLRPNALLMQEAAAKLQAMPESAQKAAAAMTLFGQAGETLKGTLPILGQNVESLADKYQRLGLMISGDVIDRMQKTSTETEELNQKLAAIMAPFIGDAKNSLLGQAVTWIGLLVGQLQAINSLGDTLPKLDASLRTLLFYADPGLSTRIYGSGSGPGGSQTGLDILKSQATDAAAAVDNLNKALAEEKAREAEGTYNDPRKSRIEQQLAAAEQRLRDVNQALYNADRQRSSPYTGDNIPGTMDPTIVTASKGGGGGSSNTDADSIERQIARYKSLGDAARKAYDTINTGQGQSVEDLKRQVTVQQQVDEIVAKLIAKHQQVTAIQKQELYDAVQGYEQEREAAQHLLDVNNAAVETDKKYGDGQVARIKNTKDLAEQINTLRLSTEAAARAQKDFNEQQDQAARTAKRFDDNMGSFGAGIEHAAAAQARANDLFAMGEATFGAMSDAMMEGMKALSGQASKSFGEIALSFAQMIEQMAMKELAAQTVGLIMKGIGMLAGAGIGGVSPGTVSASDWADMLASNTSGGIAGVRAAGGPVDAGKPYLVGEQGAEVFVPAAAGNIVPSSGVSNAGGVTVNVDMKGGGTSDPQQATDFGRKVKEAVVNVIANEKRPGGTLYMRRSA